MLKNSLKNRNRKIASYQECIESGYSVYAQPFFINVDPNSVKWLEGQFIQFFNWRGLQNSIKGQVAKDGKDADEGLAGKLIALYEEYHAQVEEELRSKRAHDPEAHSSTKKHLFSVFEDCADARASNIFEDESDTDLKEPGLKVRKGAYQSRIPSDDSPSQSVMNRRRGSVGKENESPSFTHGKRRTR